MHLRHLNKSMENRLALAVNEVYGLRRALQCKNICSGGHDRFLCSETVIGLVRSLRCTRYRGMLPVPCWTRAGACSWASLLSAEHKAALCKESLLRFTHVLMDHLISVRLFSEQHAHCIPRQNFDINRSTQRNRKRC